MNTRSNNEIRQHFFSAKYAVHIFIAMSLVWYVFLPLAIGLNDNKSTYMYELSFVSIVGLIGVVIGYWIGCIIANRKKRRTDFNYVTNQIVFHWTIWTIFIVFFIVSIATADAIPILSALSGADANQLSAERGAFLKGRTGYLSVLVFVNTLVVSAFLPYSLACLYYEKSKYFKPAFTIFVIYCVSYLVKALFITALIPLFYMYSTKNKVPLLLIGKFVVLIFSGLFVMTLLSFGTDDLSQEVSIDSMGYFDPSHRPSDAFGQIIWRGVAIPVVTAADTLLVHFEQYSGEYLMGRTNGLLSFTFGLDRIEFEKEVFAYQYGGFNAIANANAYFLTEGYINFGFIGVMLYGLVVGCLFAFFSKSNNIAFSAVWPLFAMGIFNASLLSMLFSGGFLLFFLYIFIIQQ